MRMSNGAMRRHKKLQAHLHRQDETKGNYSVTHPRLRTRGKTYTPNGTAECGRRALQIAEGRLTAANGLAGAVVLQEAA